MSSPLPVLPGSLHWRKGRHVCLGLGWSSLTPPAIKFVLSVWSQVGILLFLPLPGFVSLFHPWAQYQVLHGGSVGNNNNSPVTHQLGWPILPVGQQAGVCLGSPWEASSLLILFTCSCSSPVSCLCLLSLGVLSCGVPSTVFGNVLSWQVGQAWFGNGLAWWYLGEWWGRSVLSATGEEEEKKATHSPISHAWGRKNGRLS